MELIGDDYNQMLVEAENLRNYIEDMGIRGIEELKIDINKGKPEMNITVDREKAGQFGVSTGQIGQTLRRSIFGEEASTYKDGNDDYEMTKVLYSISQSRLEITKERLYKCRFPL